MKAWIMAAALSVAALPAAGQTGSPAPATTAPTASQPGAGETGSSVPAMPSDRATGGLAPGKTAPAPVGTQHPYVVPAHPRDPVDGDDGKTAGKSNRD